MSYWNKLADTYKSELSISKETITANTKPVFKTMRELKWSNFLGDVSFIYFHNEHSLSHNNFTYSIINIKLKSKSNLKFKLKRIDVLEKIFVRIWNPKKNKILNNFLLKSNNFHKAKNIINSKQIEKLLIESLELNNIENYANLTLKTREDFIREQNVEIYIEFLLKIAAKINNI
jgi:hypothetical protein